MSDTKLPKPDAEAPLLVWLLDTLKPMSRSKVKNLLRNGQVVVNGTPITQHDLRLRPNDRVTISRERPAPSVHGLKQSGIKIVYEDDALIIIDKPPGLLAVSTDTDKDDTAFVHLNADLESRKAGRAFVVHRIDRGTSGLLIFARSEAIRDALKANWPTVEKTYLAVVEGTPTKAEGTIENYLIERRDLRVKTCPPDRPDAKRAVSRYRVLKTRGKFSLVEVKLETGRKHQIRVHLAGLGCPVVGDRDYGAKTNPLKRIALHSWRLSFNHPVSGERLELESPLSPLLERLIEGPKRGRSD
jgi:23S rRNA pseudouridine1911/1915/1917 synthase